MKLRIDRGAFIIPKGIQMLTLYQQQIYTYFYANVFIQFSSTTIFWCKGDFGHKNYSSTSIVAHTQLVLKKKKKKIWALKYYFVNQANAPQ